jgi:hypothetical protein
MEQKATITPIVERPNLPKDYGVPEGTEGTLPWEWAVERLTQAWQYWLATVRPDGRPHAVPVWGAFVDNAIWIEGGATTRWARNLAARGEIVVHIEQGREVVMVEGVAEQARHLMPETAAKVKAQYAAKYEGYTPEMVGWSDGEGSQEAGGFWIVRPTNVLGWHQFPNDGTRWRFERWGARG